MNKGTLNLIFILVFSLFLTSCSDSGNGGITGTGSGYLAIDPSPPFVLLDDPPNNDPDFPPPPDQLCDTFSDNNSTLATESISNTELSPPDWLFGNWVGTRSTGDSISIVASSDEVSYGYLEQQTPISGSSSRIINELQKSDLVYVFAVVEEQFNGMTVCYEQQYENLGNSSVLYTLKSPVFIDESIQLVKQISSDLLLPPLWLQGQWVSENDTRTITQRNIRVDYKDSDLSFDYMSILNSPSSTLNISYSDDRYYEISVTYLSPNINERVSFKELYRLNNTNEIVYISSDNNDIYTRLQ